MEPADELRNRTRTPQKGLESDEDLGDGEGLDDIVVAAGVETGNPIVHPVERGEEQDRGVLSLGAQRLAHVTPIGIGQSDVDDQQVDAVRRPEGLDRVMAVACDQDVVVVHLEGIGQDAANRLVVLADAHCRHAPIVPEPEKICALIRLRPTIRSGFSQVQGHTLKV